MQISNKVAKTTFITYNNEQIEVDSLPKNIRLEIETLDRISQLRMDKLSELEILELAIQAQKLKILELIKPLKDDKESDHEDA